ncbi:MAG: hypothetical protein WC695_08885 [Candidatus Omnitrophota bacterium]
MDTDIKRDHGEQPLGEIMAEYKLKPHDLVSSSTEQLSHKMIARAAKGRRLTPHMQYKILHALNKATKKNYSLSDLFNY